MREIKFRYIWERPKSGAGTYCPSDPKIKITYNSLIDMEEGTFNEPPPYSWENNHQMGKFSILVARNEYTGLLDKNSVEIYEGDIIEYPAWIRPKNSHKQTRAIVVWHIDGYAGKIKGEWAQHSLAGDWQKSKVIGNIYENKDLLEGK